MTTTTNMVQIQSINVNTLLDAFEVLLVQKLSTIQQSTPVIDIEFITRNQVAEIFGVTLPTVHNWINTGVLTAYKIANKTRFKKSEVLASCKPIAGKRERRA